MTPSPLIDDRTRTNRSRRPRGKARARARLQFFSAFTPKTSRRNASPARIREEIGASLKRLRTDYIDLYQLHWPDPGVPIEESAGALATLLQEGKIRAVGVSNLDRAQTERFRAVAPVQTTQPPYNLFERDIEADLLPYAAQTGLVLLAYGSLCRGLLSGRMTSGYLLRLNASRSRSATDQKKATFSPAKCCLTYCPRILPSLM